MEWEGPAPDEWHPVPLLNGRLQREAKALWRRTNGEMTAAASSERRKKEAARYQKARQRVDREQGRAVRRQPSRGAKDAHVHGRTYRGEAGNEGTNGEENMPETADGDGGTGAEGADEARDDSTYGDMDEDWEGDDEGADDAGDEEWIPEDYSSDMEWDEGGTHE